MSECESVCLRVAERTEKLRTDVAWLLRRRDQSDQFHANMDQTAIKLRERIAELKAEAAVCSMSEAELAHHQVKMRFVEDALQRVTGQLSVGLQRDILVGMAVTLVHVFLFRLFVG